MEHMMVIVPVDSDENETEQILTERRHDAFEGGPVRTTRDCQFEHHNRDDDGDDAIAECLQAAFAHCPVPVQGVSVAVRVYQKRTEFACSLRIEAARSGRHAAKARAATAEPYRLARGSSMVELAPAAASCEHRRLSRSWAMCSEERMYLAHRQRNSFLGLLPREDAHFGLRREHRGLHGHGVWMRRDIVRQDQYGRLAIAHEIA